MQKRSSGSWWMWVTLLIVPALALSQAAPQTRTLIVNGRSGQVNVVQTNGHSYVDLEALARIANGSLGYSGNQITLTLPASPSTPPSTTPVNQPAEPGLSRSFLKAGIEAMSLAREWHSALASAIKNGFPITADWLADYRGRAATGLRLAEAAVSTDSDRNAVQLLRNEFNNMSKLSDQYVATRQSMKYIAPDALAHDPLDRKIINCGHSLGAMAASGEFLDDGSCQ